LAVATGVLRLCLRRCAAAEIGAQAAPEPARARSGSLPYSTTPPGQLAHPGGPTGAAEGVALRARGCARQNRCIEVIALAEKRIGEELERGRAELLFGDR
jgi:hypothetical protein